MRWTADRRLQQSWLVVGAVGGLLIVMMIAGTAGLIVNRNVNRVAQQALTVDVRLEDSGDDLRAAVLDLRHYHRNLVFAGPSRGGLNDLDSAYRELHEEINELDQLGIIDEPVASSAQLREMANQYYVSFRPAADLYDTNPAAFTATSDQGLVQIATMEEAAREIDRLGEQRATRALEEVEQSTRTATVDLAVILTGLAVVGVGLAFLTVKISNEMRVLYADQRAATEELTRALVVRNQFIADVSHELRTPLTVLRGNAEVGLELDRLSVLRPFLEEIVKESARMARLVEDLLFLARSDADTVPLELKTFNAQDLLLDFTGPVTILAQQHEAAIVIDGAVNGFVDADRERLEQAVLILVDNAAKYGSRQQPILLRVSTQSGWLAISIQDDGPGIPEEEIPQIFERFYRIDKTRSRQFGGAGLGLAIARSIVEAHGGRIVVDSHLGVGTTMSIQLPLLAT